MMAMPTGATAARVRLVLLFLLLGMLLGVGALPRLVAWQASPPPSTLVAWPNTACVSRTERGVGFEFLGYQTQPDGTTVLAVRITNPQRLALDALGFTSAGWQRVAPTEGSTYPGQLGTYTVQWVLDLVLPKQAAFRFRPQGNWFQKGASETFVLTVRTFDAQQPLVAWARANLQLAVLRVRPADFPCLIVPPTPTPTLTPTLTPTPTPPFSPLPTPTPAPNLTLDDYQFGAPTVVLTDTQSLEVQEWLPDGQWTLISVSGYDGGLRLFNPATHEVRRLLADGFGGYKAVWLASTQQFAITSAGDHTATLSFVGLAGPPAKLVTQGNFTDHITGNRDRVIVLDLGSKNGEKKLLQFDGVGNSIPLLSIHLQDYGFNTDRDFSPVTLRWHPTEPRVLLSARGGFIVFNIETGEIQPYNLRFLKTPLSPPLRLDEHQWGIDAQWSPDGNHIAVIHANGELGHLVTHLVLLNPTTKTMKYIPLPLTELDDIAWAPNSRQLAVSGENNSRSTSPTTAIFLVDILTDTNKEIAPFANLFVTGGVSDDLAWSQDGHRFLFRCIPPNLVNGARVALCESMVTIGGMQ